MTAGSTCAVQMFDVALLAPDVLLARLQREAVGAVSPRIDRDADDAAGQRALIGVFHGDIGGMRTAIAHRHAEPLHGADGDVGSHFARRLQKRERQRVGGNDGERLGGMQLCDELGEVVEGAAYAGILEKRAENRLGVQILERIADDDLPAERLGARLEHGDRLRQALLVDEEGGGLRFCDAVRKRHRLGRGGCLVEQRGIGDIEPGQIRDQRLEVEKRLEAPLADLRLDRACRRCTRPDSPGCCVGWRAA